MTSFMTNFYLNVTHKTQKRDPKTLKQAKELIISESNFDEFLKVLDEMSDQSIINSIREVNAYQVGTKNKDNNISIYFYHGTKMNEMIAKKSAKFLKKHYKLVNISCFKGKGHCENSIINPEIMIGEVKKILNKKEN